MAAPSQYPGGYYRGFNNPVVWFHTPDIAIVSYTSLNRALPRNPGKYHIPQMYLSMIFAVISAVAYASSPDDETRLPAQAYDGPFKGRILRGPGPGLAMTGS